MILTSVFGRKFEIMRSGIHLVGLLPISKTIITHNLPIVYTREGIYVVVENSCPNRRLYRAEDFTFIDYESFETIDVEGKNIIFAGKRMIKTPSSPCARFHVKFISEIKKLSPAGRDEHIKAFMSASHDLESIKKIVTSNSKSFAILKVLSSYLFALVFLILPAALFTDLARYINFDAFTICILLIYSLLLLVSFLTLRRLYAAENDIRCHVLLSIIFSPVNACHVLSYLTKNLYFKFDCFALAAYFMPREAFKELARRELFLIDYLEAEMNNQGWLKFWQHKKRLILDLLDVRQISRQEILAPPQMRDQTALYFCPFCMAEYRQKRHQCIDCEVALKEINEEN